MRLPNPLAAYRRWALKRRLQFAGFDAEMARQILEVYDKDGRSEAEKYAFNRLVAQCYHDLKALDGGLN